MPCDKMEPNFGAADCVSQLFRMEPLPEFESPDQLLANWGEKWGINSEIGNLRAVLLHRPGNELSRVDEADYLPERDALIGKNLEYYWRGNRKPDLEKMRAEHDAYAAVLRENGVLVHYDNAFALGSLSKSINVRDVGMAVPGGMIVGRPAPRLRRGEELTITKAVGALGMPILKTISGTGTMEGGGFIFLDPAHVAVALSTRCNEEGIRQVRQVLEPLGIEVIVVPVPGYGLHIDGLFSPVDYKTVLLNSSMVAYPLLEWFDKNGWKMIEADKRDTWMCINCVPLKPGKVIMMKGYGYTADLAAKNGIEVIELPYNECLKNGGGIHCATLPLIRDFI